MAEVLGVLGFTVQLWSCCEQIYSLIQDIRGCTSTLRRYQQQIKELRILSDSIIKNNLFHTEDIQNIVHSILDAVKAIDLTALLQKSPLYRTWALLVNKEDLLQIFETIDRKKSSLTLHMQLAQTQVLYAQTEVLYDIKTDILAMSGNGSKSRQNMFDRVKMKISSKRQKKLESRFFGPASDSSTSTNTLPAAMLEGGSNLSRQMVRRNKASMTSLATSESSETSAVVPDAPVAPADAPEVHEMTFEAVFTRNIKTGKGDQTNGNRIIEGQSACAVKIRSDNIMYSSNLMRHGAVGMQVNGNYHTAHEGGGSGSTRGTEKKYVMSIPVTGYYADNAHHGDGGQTNGRHFEVKKIGGDS